MNELLMGFGREDFTPDGPIHLNGSVVGTQVMGGVEKLYASSIAWKQGDLTVLQFSLDLRNIYAPFHDMIHEKISQAVGLPKDRIIISVTHNHSSPEILMLKNPAVGDWYERIGEKAIIGAGLAALADLSPVTGAVAGRSHAEKVAMVRRYFREDGALAGVTAPKTPSPIVRHETEGDSELRAVRFTREGKKDVVLINFQTHAATALATHKDRISSDFVGFTREVVEADGNTLAFYLQGACGNLNTLSRIPEEKATMPEGYWESGRIIGRAALAALEKGEKLELGELKLTAGELECHVNHSRDHLVDYARAFWNTSDPEEREKILEESGITSRYECSAIIKRSGFDKTRMMPLSTLACGEFAMGFAPIELFDTCGKAFRGASPYEMTFFCGYSMGSHSYMPSAIAFPNGGYESMECHYVPGTGEMVALELARQLNEMKKAK